MASGARYDRQLRIWGAHGQQLLESARICVLNSGPCATEVLKNLVLGGIGGFTLVDDAVVKDEDFGKNYLVDIDGKGTALPEVACRLLKELNESVQGTAIQESAADVIDGNPDFFEEFSLIVATQLPTVQLKKLIAVCQTLDIPLISLRSYGLLGLMKVYFKEAYVVESKPDDEVPDLRLADPWPALVDYVKSFDFDQMEDVEHSHVPYIVILLRAAEEWRASSTEKLPTTSVRKREFRSIIQQLRRSEKATGVEEENFEEASRAAYQFWTPYSIPQTVRDILDDPCANSITESSSCPTPDSIHPDFWIIISAFKRFVNEFGTLPLNGSIPDMTSTTQSYLNLQTIYSEKAKEDAEKIWGFVNDIVKRLGIEPEDGVPKDMISLMCKNARNLRYVRSLPKLLSEDPNLLMHLRNRETFRNTSLALLLEAVDVFYETHARAPGTKSVDDWTQDAHLLMKACHTIAGISQLEQELQSEIQTMALEVCRFAAGELHNVSAVMGGIAAQEVIKLLTRQFVPFRGTLVYNAMDSTTTRL